MIAYIAVLGGIFVFSVITLLFSWQGTSHDKIRKRVLNVVEKTQHTYFLDEELDKPLWERLFKPAIRALSLRIEKFKAQNSEAKSEVKKQNYDKLKKMVWQAGLNVTASEYSLIRLLLIFGTAVGFGIVSAFIQYGIGRGILFGIFGACTAFVILRFHLSSKVSNRRKSMEQQMPEVLDLLSINVEAGLGFEQALLNVIEHFEGPLIDEMNITYREMTMGRARRDALMLLAERCELNEMKTFVGAIVQAEQLGISIKNVLRTQASAMRISRKNKIEEKAMKTSVKILLPMVGFIFPVLLIVLMGPAAVKIIQQFKG